MTLPPHMGAGRYGLRGGKASGMGFQPFHAENFAFDRREIILPRKLGRLTRQAFEPRAGHGPERAIGLMG
ncbi:hypothetical protein AA0614_2078 [Komagataeibacter saccharivorans NRIC 0614]|nr:hypothetical protein AA0614_2078 [Komagataeibacter saccharivorans NRIC 0614]